MDQGIEASTPERLSSGISGLDTLLRGGFFKNGVYIIQGSPGAGKTILANQLCFNHIKSGGRAIYVTLLSESHARMLQHLGSMSFFDASVIPDRLYYVSGFKILEEEGLKALVDVIRREVRAHRATVLILDGLVAAEETAGSDREFKKFIHEVQVQANMLNCTTFLLTNGMEKLTHPEHTMVDGLISLAEHWIDGRVERELIVRKFRGSSSLLGSHTYRISDDGLTLYPRIEALFARPSVEEVSFGERIPSGVAHLDEMLGGGLFAGSTTMLLGPSGVGKTTLGLHFLARSTPEEPGLLFGFYETPQRILYKARHIGIDLEKLQETGALEILWQPPTENLLDALGARLIDGVRRRKVRRLFIDGLGGFEDTAFFPQRVARFFVAIANEFRARGVTTVYTREMSNIVGPSVDLERTKVSPIVENFILLRYVEIGARLSRLLSIVKARDTNYDSSFREFSINASGISLDRIFQSHGALLTGAPPAKKPKMVKKRTAKKNKTETPRGKSKRGR
jgi:circadian clock protein KaiC